MLTITHGSISRVCVCVFFFVDAPPLAVFESSICVCFLRDYIAPISLGSRHLRSPHRKLLQTLFSWPSIRETSISSGISGNCSSGSSIFFIFFSGKST